MYAYAFMYFYEVGYVGQLKEISLSSYMAFPSSVPLKDGFVWIQTSYHDLLQAKPEKLVSSFQLLSVFFV